MLVFSAADFEDFRQPRPDMAPEMEGELKGVIRVVAENRWPWRLHATYDETILRALDVFEQVDQDIPLAGLNWFFDHAETISDVSIDRIAALGGGIAVQHRMAYQGEYFVERYGRGAAETTQPIARMIERVVKIAAGTDATRVAAYNPGVSLAWLVTGRTVAGMQLYPRHNCLDRETALRMWTENVTWFSNEEGRKGRIEAGQLADLIVPDRDYCACAESEIADTSSELTMVGGKVVYAAGPFATFDTPPPPAMPDWSPVRAFGGYGAWSARPLRAPGGSRVRPRGGRDLRMCERVLRARPRPRPRDRLAGQAADLRPEELLGRSRLRLLGCLICMLELRMNRTILLLLFTVATAPALAAPPAAGIAVGPQYDTTHVYVAPDQGDRFVQSFVATFGGASTKQVVVTVTPTPSSTTSQLVQTPFGTVSVFGFTTGIPYPFGAERTGYLVRDMDAAVAAARKAGADVQVTTFPDPIGRDAVIQWPGGVNMQLYWHTTPPAYAAFQTVPENRIYLSPDRVDAFVRSFDAFSGGRVVADDRHAPGVEIGRPGDTYRRVSLASGFGELTLLVTDGHLPSHMDAKSLATRCWTFRRPWRRLPGQVRRS